VVVGYKVKTMSINNHLFNSTIKTVNNGRAKIAKTLAFREKTRKDIEKQTALFLQSGGEIEVLQGSEFGYVSTRAARVDSKY